MSQAATNIQFSPDYVIPPVKVDRASVTLAGGSKKIGSAFIFVGAVALAVTGIMLFGAESRTHALVSYLVGFAVAVALGLGSLGYVMIFQQTNAGWSTSVRRVAEVVASTLWVGLFLFIPIAVWAGDIYHWMHAHGDPILDKKAGYLSLAFWYVRAVAYFGIWSFLSWKLLSYSRQQDETGDKWLTAKARRLSAPGLLVFALSTAFAAFDWLMSLDFHWFSTMFGVYYFAGAMQSATALCILIVGWLKLRGKFGKLVTDEHFHDLGKLMLAFTVFWAYIAFSQYFLIWYSNLPEETHWFNVRGSNGWEQVGYLLAFGRFLVPFLLLLWKGSKRVVQILMLISLWQLGMQCVDMFYVARPSVEGTTGVHFGLIDIVGPIGPIAIFIGVALLRLGTMPIVPIGDPRLAEALHHKNYV
jgi:hypothetical protein